MNITPESTAMCPQSPGARETGASSDYSDGKGWVDKERGGRRTPKVGIVMATNRNSEYLGEALTSVRSQTFTDWHLIVVDNGARRPDLIVEMLDNDDRMSLITINSFSTAGVARNVGAAFTDSEFVTYIDDDDVWAPHRLECHLRALDESPTAPASYSGYWHMDKDGKHFGVDWRSRQGTAADMIRGQIDTPLGGTLVVRRGDYEAIGGFSPEVPILVDFEFALRLALRGDLVYVDDLLLGYRRHANNMTSTAPANARMRRMVMESMLVRQRWSALGRGESTMADLFGERLNMHRKREAKLAGKAFFQLLRRGEYSHSVGQVSWGLSRSPGVFAAAMAAAPIRKLRSKLTH